jgi:hypothetical protein
VIGFRWTLYDLTARLLAAQLPGGSWFLNGMVSGTSLSTGGAFDGAKSRFSNLASHAPRTAGKAHTSTSGGR